MSGVAIVVLLLAGALAGVVGTAGAITSLVSYPALLVVGVAPLAAGIANIVALTTAWPGSALASRSELAGRGRWLVRVCPAAALGGVLGGLLLDGTPAGAFERIVPFLVLSGSVALLASPRLARWAEDSGGSARRRGGVLVAGVLGLSVYGGYFGAGSGVMLLALCLVMVDARLPRANALKNMLVGAGNLTAALVLIAAGPVDWAAALPLGIGVFLGSLLGPRVARRIPAAVLRPVVAAVGVGLAVQLWLTHGA